MYTYIYIYMHIFYTMIRQKRFKYGFLEEMDAMSRQDTVCMLEELLEFTGHLPSLILR